MIASGGGLGVPYDALPSALVGLDAPDCNILARSLGCELMKKG